MKLVTILCILFTQWLFSQEIYVNLYSPAENLAQDGSSWATAWSGFDKFDINDQNVVPPGTTIKVAPGIYTAGHSTYVFEDIKAIVLIKNNYNISIINEKLEPYMNGYNINSGDEVILRGSSEYKRGIHIQYTNNSPNQLKAVVMC